MNNLKTLDPQNVTQNNDSDVILDIVYAPIDEDDNRELPEVTVLRNTAL